MTVSDDQEDGIWMGFAIKNISRYQATSTAAEDLTFTHAKP